MRKVSIKSLYGSLSSEVERLPFAITRYGKVIAEVLEPSKGLDNTVSQEVGLDKKADDTGNGLDKNSNIEKDGLDKQKKSRQRIPDLKPEGMSILRWNYKSKFPEMRCQYCQVRHRECECGR